jgi:hypothetical protein
VLLQASSALHIAEVIVRQNRDPLPRAPP